MLFGKALIANRGEIACRIIRTCRRLGIATVAIYSEADRRSLHVELADEAWTVGPAPARDSYLAIETIIGVARRSGAEAIHPGYGFLSENAAFAEACAAAGVVWVGPPARAIRAMGSKAAAKALMGRAGVPLVPGYHGDDQSPDVLAAEAGRIGYPVLIKASAGGGGKGMRVVERADALAEALASAQGEAHASFGDDRVLIEKYLARPRHIEIQVFADTHGNIVHLFERDCSIQRRHQKIIEEAPAPGIDPARRHAMGDAAITAARAVGYAGAGTVEFIVEADRFYFMEMNTRLQVEHPVTEMITGLDLVEWQFRVAAGEPLPSRQGELAARGHAFEARIYAEDPDRDFLPSTGPLAHLRQPRETKQVRVDTGVRAGDTISPYYDPMIAKLIVWSETRDAALRQLAAALGEYEVVGVRTNLGLLRAIAGHPAFARADLHTGFIRRHPETLATASGGNERTVLAAAALAVLADERTGTERVSAGDGWSPWGMADAWRLNAEGYQDLLFSDGGGDAVTVRAWPQGDGSTLLDLPGARVRAEREDGCFVRLDGVRQRLPVVRRGPELTVVVDGSNHVLHLVDRFQPPRGETKADSRVTAPIPARVSRVLVVPGDIVGKGAPLLVLEAMKMELTLAAPRDGTIGAISRAPGDMVGEGEELVTFAMAADGAT
ncbi:MAG: acetyl/propionyl/methylcrotonyl-CoA carboxylase subunit alpha [Acetobacteraceae bacterium]|nr:acetyl/propionyl/methylcrotonyl-CoA carboxylase subunit alpha [Acetobacteraceae bacterium]